MTISLNRNGHYSIACLARFVEFKTLKQAIAAVRYMGHAPVIQL